MPEKIDGRVKWFHEQKGYGFIVGDNETEYFVHYSKIFGNGFKNLKEGDRVKFNYEVSNKGKGLIATDVEKQN